MFEEEIKAGVARCDSVVGPHWVWLIDIEKLQMTSMCNCIVGQLEQKAGGFQIYNKLGGYNTSRGFDIPYDSENMNSKKMFGVLQKEWVAELYRLRQERPQYAATPQGVMS